jgi:DNA-binding MarR family transcriptional regulator
MGAIIACYRAGLNRQCGMIHRHRARLWITGAAPWRAIELVTVSADNVSMDTDRPDRIGFVMHDVARLIRQRFDARSRGLGVTRPQWRALLNLAREPGMTQAELAERVEVERITASRMVDRLMAAGFVERREDPADRRVWRLHLLPPARAIVDKLATIGAEIEAEALSHVTAEEARQLAASLARIRDGLREDSRKDAA